MHPAMTVALCSYSLAALLALAFGIRYLGRREFMPYHAEAAGVAWGELSPGLRVLTLALLHGVGGGFLAVGISRTGTTANPPWALAVLAVSLFLVGAAATLVARLP